MPFFDKWLFTNYGILSAVSICEFIGSHHPGPLVLRVSYGSYVTQSLLLAGKSSLLLNMNGASFGDVALTVGRYGSVSIYDLLWFPLLHWNLGRTDFLVG
jgi:hypothetical protein